ncbi:MAG: dihydropteroate synthase [Nitrososphaerales archaeon]
MMPETKISGSLSTVKIGDSYPVRVMGVINLARNSFYSGSVKTTDEEIEETILRMKQDGANILDVGARSTAPYRTHDIPLETEKRLLSSAVKRIANLVDIPISVDTTRYEPAKTALRQGATILNDVYGLTQKDAPKLAALVSSHDCSIVITAHEKRFRRSSDTISRVCNSLEKSITFANAHGIDSEKITIDPGIGFFKDEKLSNVDWNCTVIARLDELRKLGRPILVGVSRKSFIGKLTGRKSPDLRLNGSLSATAVAIYNGAHAIRTHDVLETSEASKIAYAISLRKRFNLPELV